MRLRLRWPFGRERVERPDPNEASIEAAMTEIQASGLFDAAWYLDQYPDVAAAGVDPLRHYVAAGAREGRRASLHFDPIWYLGENPDAAAPGADPLLHYLRVGRAFGRSPTALNPAQAFDTFLAASRAGALPFARLERETVDHVHYTLGPRPSDGPLPTPPLSLLRRIGSLSVEDFDEVGRGTKASIVRCLPPGFDFRGARILDFGSGVGRVIRHFADEARTAEIWGTDIDGTSIRWSVENLTPPFRFYQMSGAPSLPFEDSSVDLVYAIAVFSQLYENWHHWAAELRRVLKPDGIFFMSYSGPSTFEEMLGRSYAEAVPDPGLYVKNPFNSWNRGGPMVFMSPAWIERYWGSLFDIDFVAPDALNDDQSICVMRKPAPGTPPRKGLRVIETATRQDFDADAIGRIYGNFDTAKPFLESYGIEASGQSTLEGWIALRGDAAERLAISIDGVDIASHTDFATSLPYRDWPDTPQTAFSTRFDATPLPHGRGRLGVRVTGRRGTAHEMSIPLLVR